MAPQLCSTLRAKIGRHLPPPYSVPESTMSFVVGKSRAHCPGQSSRAEGHKKLGWPRTIITSNRRLRPRSDRYRTRPSASIGGCEQRLPRHACTRRPLLCTTQSRRGLVTEECPVKNQPRLMGVRENRGKHPPCANANIGLVSFANLARGELRVGRESNQSVDRYQSTLAVSALYRGC
jgi:hypothetical protein